MNLKAAWGLDNLEVEVIRVCYGESRLEFAPMSHSGVVLLDIVKPHDTNTMESYIVARCGSRLVADEICISNRISYCAPQE